MKEKKLYKKPKVKKIVFRTEEKVLQNCKGEDYGGPGGLPIYACAPGGVSCRSPLGP